MSKSTTTTPQPVRPGDFICGRCEASAGPAAPETCWYCGAPLCASCWDAPGHCGHPEASLQNIAAQRAARRAAPPVKGA